MSPWTYLALGIVFEVAGTSALKMSNGFTQPWPSAIVVCGFVTALYMLSQSVKTLDIGVVYAIWSGAGVVLIALIGLLFFEEILTPAKILFMALIVIGVVGLQLHDRGTTTPSELVVD